MRHIIFYRSSSGNDYELTVNCDAERLPYMVAEDEAGSIHTFGEDTDSNIFGSLAAMSHHYKFEIISFGSDVGD